MDEQGKTRKPEGHPAAHLTEPDQLMTGSRNLVQSLKRITLAVDWLLYNQLDNTSKRSPTNPEAVDPVYCTPKRRHCRR